MLIYGCLVVGFTYDAFGQDFSDGPDMQVPRWQHTATLLQNCQVLIAGGGNHGYEGDTRLAERFDPQTNQFFRAGEIPIPVGFVEGASTLLRGGTVLVGGLQLYDPSNDAFYPIADGVSTYRATATLLRNGRVLIAGGGNPFQSIAFIYRPATDTMSETGQMIYPRTIHSAVLLKTGKVLIVGGFSGRFGQSIANVELYDPVTGTFSETGSMNVARTWATATLLNDGRVLVTGGMPRDSGYFESSAELYDPDTGTWSLTRGSMTIGRGRHTATLLNDGRVLLVGGKRSSSVSFGTGLSSAELYDPKTGTFSPAGSMSTERFYHTATLLRDGRVIIVGGAETNSRNEETFLSSSQIYTDSLTDVEKGKGQRGGCQNENSRNDLQPTHEFH